VSKKDYYALLEISKNATAADIQAAYRKLAKKYHPDRNPDPKAQALFQEINEAKEVLIDPKKREAYDRYGHASTEQGFGGGWGGFQQANGQDFDLSSMFEDLFGFGQKRGSQRGPDMRQPGADLQCPLSITLEEAFSGLQTQITLPNYVLCQPCEGRGMPKGSQMDTCQTCRGSGTLRKSQGFFVVEQECPQCYGQGQMIKNPCRSCQGQGRIRGESKVSITLPAGVDSGSKIRLVGKGEAGIRGGTSGDLYVVVQIKSHPLFERKDSDLSCKVVISMARAALGGSVSITSIDKQDLSLKIPEGTQSGSRISVPGRGMPKMQSPSQRGTLHVEVNVETPVNLTDSQKQWLESFEKENTKDNHSSSQPKVKSFFEKMRQYAQKGSLS